MTAVTFQDLTRDDLDNIRFGLHLAQQAAGNPGELASASRTLAKLEQQLEVTV